MLLKVSANISKCITTPSSRVSPHLLRKGDTLNIRTLGIVLSLCHLSLGGRKFVHQATGVLYSGAQYSLPRHPVARVRSFATTGCLYNRPHSCQVRKTAIFRCIARKKNPQGAWRTDVRERPVGCICRS